MKKKICIVILIILLLFIEFPIVMLPTNSYPNELIIVQCGRTAIKQITLKHYVDEMHIKDYVLEMKVGVWNQTYHKYKLPQLIDGNVTVVIEFSDGVNGETVSLQEEYLSSELTEKGLLIYFSLISEI